MKTLHCYAVNMFILLIISLLLTAQSIKAQNLLRYPNTQTSYWDNNGNLGIGTATASARLHLYSGNGFPASPLLKTEVIFGLGWASIQHCISIGTTNYGIYQTSSNSSGVKNYFQDPVKTGYIQLMKGNNNNAVIGIQPGVNQLDFKMDCEQSCDGFTPLTMTSAGVRIQPKLTTDYFQLSTNPGADKILVSDADGNGSWTDPTTLRSNFWLPSSPGLGTQNMYSNTLYQNVGIGTQTPIDKLQINDGAYKISLGAIPEPSMLWGSGYLGFNAAHNSSSWIFSPDGEWGNNGGGIIFTNMAGSMYFSTIGSTGGEPNVLRDDVIVRNIKLSISPFGNIGVGVQNASEILDINRSEGRTVINLITNSEDFSFLKTGNSLNAFSFGTDSHGLGHIWEGSNATSVITFHQGRVGIGNTDDLNSYSGDHKLFVEKGITTEEVTVKLQRDWADFIFNDNHKIKSISEVEQYIKTNKHLPDIPSAQEVEKNGIELGKMNSLLLQKVEELTLYIIEQQKQIDELIKLQKK